MEGNENDRLEVVFETNAKKIDTALKSINVGLNQTISNLKIVNAKFDEMGNLKSFNITNKNVKEIAKSSSQMTSSISSFSKILSTGFSLGKLYLLWNVTKRIRAEIWGWVESAIDFVETTNKFEVAMKSSTDGAYNFVNKITEAFGIARTEIMDFQSTYMNIMKSLPGLTYDSAEKVSETLVKLGLDYASLYNVDTDTAMSRIQAALVGSVKPIRSDAGYDITEATIAQKAGQLGLESSVRNLNQMEKRLLRIIVLMDQMRESGALQDFARTIEQPSNQIKILKNQVQELGVWLGNVFMGTIGAILPYINGFVMALKEIIKMFAFFVGFVNTGSGLAEGLEVADDAAQGIASGVGGAAKSAKELRKTLMGFDVLNVISTPSSGGGGGGGGGGSLDAINPAILGALKDYDNLMNNVKMKATDIRDRIMDWLGYTKVINPLTNEVSWHLRSGYTNIEKIKDALKVVGTLFAGFKIAKAIKTVLPLLTTLFTSLSAGTGIVGALASVGTSLGAVFGVTLTGAAAAVVGALASVAAIVGVVYGAIKLYEWAVSDAVGETDKLANTSEETIQRLSPVQDAFDSLVSTVNNVSYDKLMLPQDKKKAIIKSVKDLTAQLKAALQSYIDEQIKNLNYLYKEMGLITEEEYNQRLQDIQEYFDKENAEIEKHGEELENSYDEIFDENGNIIMSAYSDWLQKLQNYENTSLEKLTLSEKDKATIRENAQHMDKESRKKYYSELLEGYAKDRDEAKKISQEKYDNALKAAEELYGTTSEEYQKIADKAKEIYDREVRDADRKYDDIYDEFAQTQADIANYIDRDSGGILTKWQVFTNNLKRIWDNLTFGKKTINMTASGTLGQGGGFSVGGGRRRWLWKWRLQSFWRTSCNRSIVCC